MAWFDIFVRHCIRLEIKESFVLRYRLWVSLPSRRKPANARAQAAVQLAALASEPGIDGWRSIACSSLCRIGRVIGRDCLVSFSPRALDQMMGEGGVVGAKIHVPRTEAAQVPLDCARQYRTT